ncbi:MAG: hypothetical protein V3W44_09520 [Dehalococcoidales bacterium]
MAVLKDMACVICDEVQEVMVEMDCSRTMIDCEECQLPTPHKAHVGGCKLKPYVTTFDGRDWSGDIEYTGEVFAETGDADGVGYTERDGTRTDSKLNADRKERIGAKRDRFKAESKRFHGSQSLTFDQGGR